MLNDMGPILRTMKKNKFAASLLIFEIAVTLAIVLNCLVAINDQQARINTPSGYDDKNILAVNIQSYGEAFAEYDYRMNMAQRDLEAIRAMPGVVDATIISSLPMIGGGNSSSMRPLNDPDAARLSAAYYITDEHFLDAFGLTLVEGRIFTEAEVAISREEDSVSPIVVTKEFADALFPDGDGLGQKITYSGRYIYEIVGILEHMFTPYSNNPRETRITFFPGYRTRAASTRYLVRTEPGKMGSVETGMTALLNKNSAERLYEFRSLEDVKGQGFLINNILKKVLTAVVFLLIFVTAVGILGMNYFAVQRRRRRIGVRRALGASQGDVVRYFMVENALIVMIGAVPGLLGAYGLNQLYHKNMPNATEMSLTAGVIGLLVLWLVAALSTLTPALKAARIEPAEATRVA